MYGEGTVDRSGPSFTVERLVEFNPPKMQQ